MNEQQVVALMKSSTSEHDWNDKCHQVKKACGGYPDFWYQAIIASGVACDTAQNWGGQGGIVLYPSL